MDVGFQVRYTFFGSEGRDETSSLPEYLINDETLDSALAEIRGFIKSWLEEGASVGFGEEGLRTFNLFLSGPFPKESCVVDHRTPEQKLADADNPEERFCRLDDAAKSRFEAGDFDAARRYALELKEMLLHFESSDAFCDVKHAADIVLGRLALQDGDAEEAKRHLAEAARTEGSPVLCSFGPNMSLARDLLLVGEKQAVLDYFEACLKFWPDEYDQIGDWTMFIEAGRMPDFGGNLDY